MQQCCSTSILLNMQMGSYITIMIFSLAAHIGMKVQKCRLKERITE